MVGVFLAAIIELIHVRAHPGSRGHRDANRSWLHIRRTALSYRGFRESGSGAGYWLRRVTDRGSTPPVTCRP